MTKGVFRLSNRTVGKTLPIGQSPSLQQIPKATTKLMCVRRVSGKVAKSWLGQSAKATYLSVLDQAPAPASEPMSSNRMSPPRVGGRK